MIVLSIAACLILALQVVTGPEADAGTPMPSDGAPPLVDGGVQVSPPPSELVAPEVLPHARVAVRVYARGTRNPIADAFVTIDVVKAGETDSEGRFEADMLCGPHHVVVQAPGFDPIVVQRDACVDGSALEIRLFPQVGAALFQTLVRAPSSRQEVRLQGPELIHTPGTLGDPFRAIESLPGVTSVAWPAPIYAVHGANPGNTGFFLDDLRVPSLFHLALGPSVIHPYFFQDLDFFPGGYPARYGRYVAGIVSARTRVAPDDRPHVSVDVRLFDAGAMVTAPLPQKGSVAVAARYSYTGTVIGLLSDDVKLSYWDYQLRADRPVGPVRLTLLAFGSNDRLTTRSSARTLAMRFHRVRLRADVSVAGGVVSASMGLGSDYSVAPVAYDIPVTMRSVSAIPRLSFTRRTAPADFELGFDGELQKFSSLSQFDRMGALDLARARTVRLLAGYASATIRAGTRLLITPEVRLDSYAISDAQKADVAPRLGARFAVSDLTWIKLAGGRFTQLPNLPLQLPGAENFGLALYGLQSSWQGSVALGTRRFWDLDASATGYVQRYVLTDVRDPSVVQNADPLAADYLVRRDALSYGLELMIRRASTERLNGWLAYTLSNNQRALGGGVIGPSDWDQRHVFNLVLGYRVGSYTVGGRVHVNTGRPVLVNGAQGQEFVRLPAFYQIDLRCDRRFLFDRFALDGYIELVNATLSRQVVGLDYSTSNAAPKQNGFRIVLPSIGVHGEF
jgi:hypothetical protein